MIMGERGPPAIRYLFGGACIAAPTFHKGSLAAKVWSTRSMSFNLSTEPAARNIYLYLSNVLFSADSHPKPLPVA
jgi:hypothetical protein